jgi:hypothetical protein
MAVNEAPRLTTRVVLLLMIAVFFLCIVADQFQCSKNGRQHFCTGRPPYRCENNFCRETVSGLTDGRYRVSCKFHGTSEVILAFVEVGPSLVSERGANISDYMVAEVRDLINTSGFPRVTNTSKNRRTSHDTFYALDDYNRLSESLQGLKAMPPDTTQLTVVNDVIPLPLYQHGEPQRYLNFDEAIDAVLPISKLDNATQLQRHFPRLYHALDAAVRRRKKNTAESAKCDSIHVVVYILVSPLASVRDVWGSNQGFRAIISRGNALVAGAVTRYISTNERLLKFLNDVQFAYLHLPMPSRQFSPSSLSKKLYVEEEDFRRGALQDPNDVAHAVQVPVTDVHASVAFCNASHNESRASACLQACGRYDKFSSLVANIEADRFDARHYGVFETTCASSAVHHNCYFEILQSTSSLQENGTFSLLAESEMFDDCLHLSPAGGRAFASCLLRLRVIRRFAYCR